VDNSGKNAIYFLLIIAKIFLLSKNIFFVLTEGGRWYNQSLNIYPKQKEDLKGENKILGFPY